MENSRLFAPVLNQHSTGEFYALVSGESLERHGAPARVAWEIERLAALRGWPAGQSLGSEAALRERLQVSRETMREAIRIVEGRGAMRMRRGRAGGLILIRPSVGRMAASFAAYMRACHISDREFQQSVRGLDQLLAWEVARRPGALPPPRAEETARHWLARISGRQTYLIYASALDELAPDRGVAAPIPVELLDAVGQGDAAGIRCALLAVPFVAGQPAGSDTESAAVAQATMMAVAMIEEAEASGTPDLGNEASLCERFDTSRSIVRQGLRILQDLDLIRVRLGRGGGYMLKQPAPIGIIRQMFVWLAARNCDPFSLDELRCDLHAASFRLACEVLRLAPPAEREAQCDRLDAIIGESEGPERFVQLRQAIAKISQCPMIDTLARSIVSYQARSYGDLPPFGSLAMFEALERKIVAHLRSGDSDGVELALRRLLDLAEGMTLEGFGLRNAAE